MFGWVNGQQAQTPAVDHVQPTFSKSLFWFSILELFEKNKCLEELTFQDGRCVLTRSDKSLHLNDQYALPGPELLDWVFHLAHEQGVRLDHSMPYCGGVLDGGAFRFHACIEPIVSGKALLNVRRSGLYGSPLSHFGLQKGWEEKLKLHYDKGCNLLVYGASGAGKSTLLVSILKAWAVDQRVCLIEDVAECPELSPFWLHLRAKTPGVGLRQPGVGLEKLTEQALRLAPDRIVLGEIRGDEGKAFLQLMVVGQHGVATTLHSSSPESCVVRLSDLGGMTPDSIYTRLSESGLSTLAIHVQRRGSACLVASIHSLESDQGLVQEERWEQW